MAEITDAIALLHGGDRPGARSRFETLWSRISDSAEAFHVCVLSHYMADAQDEIDQELVWDLRALHAALRCTDEEAQRYDQSLSIPAFMPSLHLNLADDYLKLGNLVLCNEQLALAQKSIPSLTDDSYGRMIRRGVESLAAKLQALTLKHYDTLVSVETLVYSLDRSEPLWSSTSRTANPHDIVQLVNEVASATTQEMLKHGLLVSQ